MTSLILIMHNIRSAHNVGAIIRSAEGFGVAACYMTGYTPYPRITGDTRLPHLAAKIDKSIAKTALGAEKIIPIYAHHDVFACLRDLRAQGYAIIGLEQHLTSIQLDAFSAPTKVALVLGEEVAGISEDLISVCDALVEIPMAGRKESFNVSVAAGIALYELSRKH